MDNNSRSLNEWIAEATKQIDKRPKTRVLKPAFTADGQDLLALPKKDHLEGL